jgi:hypothetical protein
MPSERAGVSRLVWASIFVILEVFGFNALRAGRRIATPGTGRRPTHWVCVFQCPQSGQAYRDGEQVPCARTSRSSVSMPSERAGVSRHCIPFCCVSMSRGFNALRAGRRIATAASTRSYVIEVCKHKTPRSSEISEVLWNFSPSANRSCRCNPLTLSELLCTPRPHRKTTVLAPRGETPGPSTLRASRLMRSGSGRRRSGTLKSSLRRDLRQFSECGPQDSNLQPRDSSARREHRYQDH